jgi:Pyruvate/2-oxoacid:ferredoxin oxidoreductase delta subunit
MTTTQTAGPTGAHMVLARTYSSPVLLGPPVSDTLIELICHMFTDDEADVVQYMRPMRPRTAAGLARASGRPLAEVRKSLHHLAHEMFILLSVGNGRRETFSLMPIVPGTFEAVMMRPSADDVSDWHRRFSSLYESLFDSGYLMEYHTTKVSPVRYIPVGEVIDAIPSAMPSDRLENILDGFDSYAIAVCQCRLSKQLNGGGCGRKLEVCTAFGDISKWLVANGKARAASKADVLETKAEAESQGLVTWMFNVGNESRLNGSCSCCGCCCGALRSISQFNMPGAIAPPHFIPAFDTTKCAGCGKCVAVCPVQALVALGEGKEMKVRHVYERCIGCGLCAAACAKGSASMREVVGYKKPTATWPRFVARSIPEQIRVVRRVSSRRKDQN